MAESNQAKGAAAEVHRGAGEIAMMAPQPDAAKAEAYFERALEALGPRLGVMTGR